MQKVTKKHVLGRAKSCQWQVFVRRRPPKQGELRTDVSKATMFQGDRAAKGFNWVSVKLSFEWADSRFAEPRFNFWEDFNFVSAWSLFGGADSRFGKPRISLQGRTDLFFSLVRKEPKVPQRFANLWTPGSDSNLRSIRDFR